MTVTLKNKAPTALLDAALQRAGFKRGETLEFKVSRKRITIVPTASHEDDRLTPEEAKRLRRSIKEMRQGKVKPWGQIKQ